MSEEEKVVPITPGRKSGEAKRAPLWLRIILMLILLIVVVFAFYMNNLDIIERLDK